MRGMRALVVLSAAALGSTRPMELPDRHVPLPEAPELVIPSTQVGGPHA